MKRTTMLVSALVFGALSTSALAKVPQAQVDRLGNDLTPMGAEKAGDGGDIPAWTGGLQTVPSNVNYKPGDHLADPFKDDPVKYTITSSNAGQYDDVLTPGYKALLSTYKDYKMNVYQTRRSCAFPDKVYEANKRNAAVGELVGGGSGISEAIFGFPFPIPNTALEMIWNHTLRYRSFKVVRQFAAAPVTRSGDYTMQIVQDEAILNWSDPAAKRAEDLDNISLYYISNTIAPARGLTYRKTSSWACNHASRCGRCRSRICLVRARIHSRFSGSIATAASSSKVGATSMFKAIWVGRAPALPLSARGSKTMRGTRIDGSYGSHLPA